MWSWFWSYLKGYWKLLLAGSLLTLGVAVLNMVNPFLGRDLVDKVIIGGQTDLLWQLLAIMTGAVLVKAVIRYLYQMVFEQISQSSIKRVREDLFRLVQDMDFAYHDRTKTGDLMAHMTGDIEAMRHFLAWVIYQVLENGSIFLVAVGCLLALNPLLTLSLLAVTPFIAWAAVSLSRRVLPSFRSIRDQFSRLNSVVQENIAGNRVVRAFVREGHEIGNFARENDAYRDRNLESAGIWGTYIPLIEFFSGLLLPIMVVVGGILIIQGAMTVGELVVFNGLIWAITNPLRMAGWLVNDVQRFVASTRRLHELSGQVPVIRNATHLVGSGLAAPARIPDGWNIKGKVQFVQVEYAYPNSDGSLGQPVLLDFSFTVEPGQTIGIVGGTGSGKTSLARLLCRFQDPVSGRILLDDKDLRDYPLEVLRSHVGIAMQDVFLFSDTIEGNIAFGQPDMDMERVIHSATMANAHQFIQELPQGYDTIVGERGVGLSGGQRQRVALARLLAKAPPVMILDDTTSAVDVETEERLQRSIRGLHGRCTLFVIAHRISSVKHADLILVLDQGRLVEQGTHSQLLAAGGIYTAVCRHQAGMED